MKKKKTKRKPIRHRPKSKAKKRYLFLVLVPLVALFVLYFSYLIFGHRLDLKNNKTINNSNTNSFSQNANTNENIGTHEDRTNTPILMYHHIRINPKSDNKIEQGLDVAPENFEAEMRYLNEKGYKTISLNDLFVKKDKDFVITFDDGYKDVVDSALPILKKYNFTAAIFIINDKVGTDGYLTWDDINILKNAGWEVGSHTLSHPNLVTENPEKAKTEIYQSKKILEEKLSSPVIYFCYPSGKFNKDVENMVSGAGYVMALTTQFGKNNQKSDMLLLKRVRVSGQESQEKFQENIAKENI